MPTNMWKMLCFFCVFQAGFHFLRFEVAVVIFICHPPLFYPTNPVS